MVGTQRMGQGTPGALQGVCRCREVTRHWDTETPGYREHPPQSYLREAERGTPLGSRKRVSQPQGRPNTPAAVGSLEKRMPAAERQGEHGSRKAIEPDNPLDRAATAEIPNPKGCRRETGEPLEDRSKET